MALNKVYAVYGSDPECNGLLRVFANKQDAEVFMQDVIKYNKTRPYTIGEIAKEATEQDDLLFAYMCNAMEIWREFHPCEAADLYEEFFISEIEVH